jgi:hypothetical protein
MFWKAFQHYDAQPKIERRRDARANEKPRETNPPEFLGHDHTTQFTDFAILDSFWC